MTIQNQATISPKQKPINHCENKPVTIYVIRHNNNNHSSPSNPPINQPPQTPSDNNIEDKRGNPFTNFFRQSFDNVRHGINRFLANGADVLRRFRDWFVSQVRSWSNPNEDAPGNGNCAMASLLMIGRMFGKIGGGPQDANAQIELMRRISGASRSEYEGAYPSTYARGARNLGLNAVVKGGASMSDLYKGLSSGKKYILALDPGRLYANIRHGSHAIVLVGMDPRRGVAMVADPGDTRGPREVPISRLNDAMAYHNNTVVEVWDKNRTGSLAVA